MPAPIYTCCDVSDDIHIKDLARAPEIVPSIFYFFQFFLFFRFFFDFFDFFCQDCIKDLARAPEIVPKIFNFLIFFFFRFFLIFSIFFARTVYITIQSDRVYRYIPIGSRHFYHFVTHFAALSLTEPK